MTDIAALHAAFGGDGRFRFDATPGGIPIVDVTTASAVARISLSGGQILGYQISGCEPVLWLSQLARDEPGVPIRGGIPICWPWFGRPAAAADKPAHGIVRQALWECRRCVAISDSESEIELRLCDSEKTRVLWPFGFELVVCFRIGPTLAVTLSTRNINKEPFMFEEALHSYFAVENSRTITIRGVEGRPYRDATRSLAEGVECKPLRIAAETDRIYNAAHTWSAIDDPGNARTIHIVPSDAASIVIWNPWQAKAKRMSDYGDLEYRQMVCVENGNIRSDRIVLEAGAEHTMQCHISVGSLEFQGT